MSSLQKDMMKNRLPPMHSGGSGYGYKMTQFIFFKSPLINLSIAVILILSFQNFVFPILT